MRATRSSWSTLRVGMYIQDQSGVTWKVIKSREDGHLGLQNRDGQKVIMPPKPASHPVTVMVPTDPEALQALQEGLGASVIGEYDQITGSWMCPTPPFSDADYWTDHLSRFHAVWVESEHEKLHAETPPSVPHSHA